MAEALMRYLIESTHPPLPEWEVASAGCWAYPGMPATSKAIAAAAALGADLSEHASQAVSADLLERYNLILCMEIAHVDFIKRHFSETAEKTFLLSEMASEKFEIDDPVGQSQTDYQKSAREILSLIQNGWQKIKALSAPTNV